MCSLPTQEEQAEGAPDISGTSRNVLCSVSLFPPQAMAIGKHGTILAPFASFQEPFHTYILQWLMGK